MTTRIIDQQTSPAGVTHIRFRHNNRPGLATGMADGDTIVSIHHDGRRWETDAADGLTPAWLTAYLTD